MVNVWFILAAALNPSKNLPFGAGVVTVLGVASLTYKKLIAMALIFEKKIREKSSAWIRTAVRGAITARELQNKAKDVRFRSIP